MKSGELQIRPWEAGDFARLATAAPGLSSHTLLLRFHAGMPSLPSSYLTSTAGRWPARWDAVAALIGERLVGWAEFGRYADAPERADVGICVVDAEQGRGIGTALAAALLAHVRTAGLASVHADIEPGNAVARRLWRRTTGVTELTVALPSRDPAALSRTGTAARAAGAPATSAGGAGFPRRTARCRPSSAAAVAAAPAARGRRARARRAHR